MGSWAEVGVSATGRLPLGHGGRIDLGLEAPGRKHDATEGGDEPDNDGDAGEGEGGIFLLHVEWRD